MSGDLVLSVDDWLALCGHFMLWSLLSIGGAITTAPDMHRYLVDQRHWLTDPQFSSSIAIAQAALALANNVAEASKVGFPQNIPFIAGAIAQGATMNMELDQSVSRDLGVLDYCRLHDITLQTWSPFQAGFFNGPFLGSDKYPELNAVIDRLAAVYEVPAIAIATAWITRHPARWQVVIGTTTPERVKASAMGSDIPLTKSEWYEMFRAAGYLVP